MTQLSDKDHKAQMADMKSFDEQMPCVGIFWYDMETKSFFCFSSLDRKRFLVSG